GHHDRDARAGRSGRPRRGTAFGAPRAVPSGIPGERARQPDRILLGRALRVRRRLPREHALQSHRDAARNAPRNVVSSARMRQVVIGVDAMEWRLVQRWASAGVLPTFERLMRDGCTAELASVGDTLPDAVWTSFV